MADDNKASHKKKIGKVLLGSDDASVQNPKIQSPNAALEQQIVELTDALQRERADAMNIRRRHDEQMASLRTTVKAHLVKDLLPIIDNLERALKHAPECHAVLDSASHGNVDEILKQVQDDIKKYDDYIKGVQKIVGLFEKTLADMGVERIKTVGEHFNPHLHEAISMEEGDGEHEIVSEELQSGYKLGDEVIRHAMVRVKVA